MPAGPQGGDFGNFANRAHVGWDLRPT
jgi:hypothetical protein